MSELFISEKRRHKEQWIRAEKILKENRKRYHNKTDVLEEALNLLEEKLMQLKNN